MRMLVGFLVAGTVANLAVGWGASSPEVIDASNLSMPAPAPAWMLGASLSAPASTVHGAATRTTERVALPGVGHVSLDADVRRSTEWDSSRTNSGDSDSGAFDPSTFEGARACKLVVVVRNSCPFCQHAATRASESEAMVRGVTWVASTAAEADSFRIAHPRLTVIHAASAMSDLQVQGVPAAFLIDDGSIVSAWAFRGDEAPESIAQRGCRDDARLALEVGT